MSNLRNKNPQTLGIVVLVLGRHTLELGIGVISWIEDFWGFFFWNFLGLFYWEFSRDFLQGIFYWDFLEIFYWEFFGDFLLRIFGEFPFLIPGISNPLGFFF